MTSKEAVELARREFEIDFEYDENNEWLRRVIEGLKEAEKDLEILEILKYLLNHLEATFNTKYFSDCGIIGTIIKDYFINNDITGKVEEWLKNGN